MPGSNAERPLCRWCHTNSIIPDPYNPLDWNRYSYARNNPINYTDPTGHDPYNNGSVSDRPCPPSNSSDYFLNPKDDPDLLTNGGQVALQYYYWAYFNAGWWNGYQAYTLTPEQFLGIFLLYEASTNRAKHFEKLKDAFGYQLFMTAAGDWGAVPYCKGEVCRKGIFNFMASNMAWDKRRDATGNSWLEDRFGPPKDSYMPPGYDKTPESIAKDALDVGTTIMNNRSKYRSPEDPYDVPFYWGYRTESDGRSMAGVWNFHWTINYAPLPVH